MGFLLAVLVQLVVPRALAQPPTAITGVVVFADPWHPPLENGVIVMAGGRLVAVGPAAAVRIPTGARLVRCDGCAAMAGFWNLHVHFSEPVWLGADTAGAARLTERMDEMLLRWGFAHVLDTGSFPQTTLALRRRIDRGEVAGPAIRTAGTPFTSRDGTPFYLAPLRLPEIRSAAGAADSVRARLAEGADFIKIFAAAPVGRDRVAVMPLGIVRAITAEAHRRHRLVAAHPTNVEGALAAVDGGVDLLLHTTPDGGKPWDSAFVARLVAAKIAVAPTLKLWHWELGRAKVAEPIVARFARLAEQQIGAFAKAGGDVVFGTDVGYMADYDPAEEYAGLTRAGLDFTAILASLTTTPARRLGDGSHRGRLAPGFDADVVLIDGRPDRDPTAWTRVRFLWRGGRAIYQR